MSALANCCLAWASVAAVPHQGLSRDLLGNVNGFIFGKGQGREAMGRGYR